MSYVAVVQQKNAPRNNNGRARSTRSPYHHHHTKRESNDDDENSQNLLNTTIRNLDDSKEAIELGETHASRSSTMKTEQSRPYLNYSTTCDDTLAHHDETRTTTNTATSSPQQQDWGYNHNNNNNKNPFYHRAKVISDMVQQPTITTAKTKKQKKNNIPLPSSYSSSSHQRWDNFMTQTNDNIYERLVVGNKNDETVKTNSKDKHNNHRPKTPTANNPTVNNMQQQDRRRRRGGGPRKSEDEDEDDWAQPPPKPKLNGTGVKDWAPSIKPNQKGNKTTVLTKPYEYDSTIGISEDSSTLYGATFAAINAGTDSSSAYSNTTSSYTTRDSSLFQNSTTTESFVLNVIQSPYNCRMPKDATTCDNKQDVNDIYYQEFIAQQQQKKQRNRYNHTQFEQSDEADKITKVADPSFQMFSSCLPTTTNSIENTIDRLVIGENNDHNGLIANSRERRQQQQTQSSPPPAAAATITTNTDMTISSDSSMVCGNKITSRSKKESGVSSEKKTDDLDALDSACGTVEGLVCGHTDEKKKPFLITDVERKISPLQTEVLQAQETILQVQQQKQKDLKAETIINRFLQRDNHRKEKDQKEGTKKDEEPTAEISKNNNTEDGTTKAIDLTNYDIQYGQIVMVVSSMQSKDCLDTAFDWTSGKSLSNNDMDKYLSPRQLPAQPQKDRLDHIFEGFEKVVCRDDYAGGEASGNSMVASIEKRSNSIEQRDLPPNNDRDAAAFLCQEHKQDQGGDSLDCICGQLEGTLGIGSNDNLDPKMFPKHDMLDDVCQGMENVLCQDPATSVADPNSLAPRINNIDENSIVEEQEQDANAFFIEVEATFPNSMSSEKDHAGPSSTEKKGALAASADDFKTEETTRVETIYKYDCGAGSWYSRGEDDLLFEGIEAKAVVCPQGIKTSMYDEFQENLKLIRSERRSSQPTAPNHRKSVAAEKLLKQQQESNSAASKFQNMYLHNQKRNLFQRMVHKGKSKSRFQFKS